MGATAHAIGAAMFEVFAYDEEGNLLTPNFYDYHVPAHARHAAAQDRRRSSPRPRSRRSARRGWARAEAAGSTASAPRSRTLSAPSGGAIVTSSHNPYHRVWEMLRHPERSREKVEVSLEVKRRRDEGVRRAARGRLERDQRPVEDGEDDARRRELRDRRRPALERQGQGAARARWPEDDDRSSRSSRSARSSSRRSTRRAQGVGAMMNMTTSFTLTGEGEHDLDGLGGRRQDRRPGRLDGSARAAADHQPAGRERAGRARRAGAGGEGRRPDQRLGPASAGHRSSREPRPRRARAETRLPLRS